jgi:hypothetical protein
MKRIISLVAVVLLLLSSAVSADDAVPVTNAGATNIKWFTPLSKKELLLMGGTFVLAAIDWSQTEQIARKPEKYSEINPILGRHPSVGATHTYAAIAAASYVLASWALPRKPPPQLVNPGIHRYVNRENFMMGIMLLEAGCVTRNLSVGLGLGYRF